jgi:hypothetical protein
MLLDLDDNRQMKRKALKNISKMLIIFQFSEGSNGKEISPCSCVFVLLSWDENQRFEY